jgi:hypothetical protein
LDKSVRFSGGDSPAPTKETSTNSEASVSPPSSPTAPVNRSPRSLKRAQQKAAKVKQKKRWERKIGKHVTAPSIPKCQEALQKIKAILRPLQPDGKAHQPFVGDKLLRFWLELMELFLRIYTSPHMLGDPRYTAHMPWKLAARKAAELRNRGKYTSERLCKWTREFLSNCRGSTRDTQPNKHATRTTVTCGGGGVDGDEVVRVTRVAGKV